MLLSAQPRHPIHCHPRIVVKSLHTGVGAPMADGVLHCVWRAAARDPDTALKACCCALALWRFSRRPAASQCGMLQHTAVFPIVA